MNTREYDDEDYREEREQKSDYEEWKEEDDSRRYREYESDNRSPY